MSLSTEIMYSEGKKKTIKPLPFCVSIIEHSDQLGSVSAFYSEGSGFKSLPGGTLQ